MDADREPVFPVQQMPSLLFPPPPPRPLALGSSSSSSSSFATHHTFITSFPILVLTILGILTTSVLLLTYYIFVIRCCLNWHSRHSADAPAAGLISRRHRRGSVSSSLPAVAEPRGLEEAAIQSLPAFKYRKAIKKDTAHSSACAVCISEFQEEERVRLLPSCLHVFHVDCIDTWLQGNANCPLCRSAIATNNSQLPLDQLMRPEEVVIQVITDPEEEEEGTQEPRQEVNTAASGPADDATTDQQVSSKKRKNQNAWHISISKGDECIAVRKDRDVLPLRRSFSMDSLGGAGEVKLQIQNIQQRSTHFHGDVCDSSSSTGTL
uniref:RING-type E3 ubiquitin transferase n=1 Tax=Leersia perrieri TaxID=77586 RepID=A0A0D9VMS6_9ORYZ